MSDTAVTPTNETPTLQPHPETAVPATPPGPAADGDAPRLGGGPIAAPAPIGTPAPETFDASPTLPDSAPVLPASNAPVATPPPPAPEPTNAEERFAQNAIDLEGIDLPTLPDAAAAATPVIVEDVEDDNAEAPPTDGEPEHPMAHLMPKKSKPTEASIRAAEQRAIKKAKVKKIKIGVFVGALAVSALAGPPLVSWLTNAINESGNTSTETGE